MPMNMPMNGMMGGFGLLMGLACLLFLILLVVGAVLLVRWLLGGAEEGSTRSGRALELAKERLASGELSPDEFTAIKQTLKTEG